VVAAVAAGKN